MTNSNISDIANSVALGDNARDGCILGATAKAGMAVYYYNTTGVKPIEGAQAMATGLAGVLQEHYATGIGSNLTTNQRYTLIKTGKVAVFVDDPGKDIGEGTQIHLSGATAGSFGWLMDKDFVALSGFIAVGKSIAPVSNGSTVAKVRLYGQ